MKANSAKTHFIAFYSYKGGVGRTLALANCARALAASGKRVVVMDFDLEAPGLEHFEALRPRDEKKPKKNVDYPPIKGFAEYIHQCRNGEPPAHLKTYIHHCTRLPNDKGELWLMPAGQRNNPEYQEILALDWERFYREEDGYRLMENLRGHIEDEIKPDYVLMDARTGLTEVGGIATHQLADMVVLLFNLNRQNLEGTKRVHDSLTKLGSPPTLLLAASPIPAMPTSKGTPYYEKMQIVRTTLKKAKNAGHPIVIPYQPILAWEERILVDEKDDPFDFDGAYRQLLKLILDTLDDPNTFLDQAMYQWRDNDIKGAIETLEAGLVTNPDDSNLLARLAEFQQKCENFARAKELYERLLSIQKIRYGDKATATLNTMNDLAENLRMQDDYLGAQKLHEYVLNIRLGTIGGSHHQTLTSMNNLANVFWAQGNHEYAQILQNYVLNLRSKTLGPDHPDVVLSLNNLANLCKIQGQYESAEPLYKRVLTINEKTLDPDHHEVATSLSNLADLHKFLGHYTQAEPLFRRALAIREKIFGSKHPDTCDSAFNLLCTLRELQETEAAHVIFRNHLAWLLQSDPVSLGEAQRNIQQQLNEYFQQNGRE